MIAIVQDRVGNAHDRFVAILPAIKQMAHHAFRGQQPEERAELVQETIANAYVAFARLVQLERLDLAFATPLTVARSSWARAYFSNPAAARAT